MIKVLEEIKIMNEYNNTCTDRVTTLTNDEILHGGGHSS